MRNRVDCRWDVAAVALVANLFASATNRGMGWFYVAFIEEFSVDRQTASWPGSILLACYRSSGMLVALLHKRISLFWIGLVGSVFLWGGMMASAFAPSIAWISFTMGFVHGIGAGVTLLSHTVVVLQYFSKYRGIAVGLLLTSGPISALLFPAVMSALTVAYGLRGALTVFSAIIMNIFAFRVMLKEPLWLSSAGEMTQRHVQRRRHVLKTTEQLIECDVSLLTKADEPAGTAFSVQKLLHEAHRRSISNLEAETVDIEEDVPKTEICLTEHDILRPMKDACSKHSEEFMFACQGFKKCCVAKVDRSKSLLSDEQDAQARHLLGPTNSLTSPDACLDELSQDNATGKQSPQVCQAYRKIDKDVETMARENAGRKPATSQAKVSTVLRQLLLRVLQSIVPATSSAASFIAAVLASMLLDYVNSVHLFTMVDYARDKGVSHTHASMALTYAAAPEIFGRLLLPYTADIGWVSRPSLACACTIAAGILFGVTPETKQVMHLVVRALSSVLMAALLTMRQVLVADYMGPEAISLVSGVSGSLLVPVLLCNPIIFGYFRDKMGSYDNLYRIVAGLISGAGLVLFVYLFRSSRSRRTTMKSSTGAL